MKIRVLAFTCSFFVVLTVLASCTSILGDFDVAEPSPDEAGTGAPNATACTANTECASGHCTDGVCCEAACNGVCESCKLPGSPGKCVPIPANTDPELECKQAPLPEAGPPPDAGKPDAASTDGGDASADADAAAPVDAGAGDAGDADIADAAPDVGFNVPEGGVTTNEAVCAGTCNGQRACAYPARPTTCGTQFCNTEQQSGRFACDGTGRCSLDLAACTAYTCAGAGCRTACANQSDCLDTHFCNPQGGCQEKLGNGVGCTLPNQCQTGFCVSNVCCSSQCDFAGGTCVSSNNVGSCKCSVDCGTGTCRLYYRDADGDGFGDKAGTVANSGAVVGCSNAAPPAGFLADNTDCDDKDANAKPGQTSFFGTPSLGIGTYDYNCDGQTSKELAEFPGGFCTFCGSPTACPTKSTCDTANQTAVLSCALGSSICGINPIRFCDTCGSAFLSKGSYSNGFTRNVACGTTDSYTTCGTCTVANGTVSGSSSASKQQRCR